MPEFSLTMVLPSNDLAILKYLDHNRKIGRTTRRRYTAQTLTQRAVTPSAYTRSTFNSEVGRYK